MEKSRSAMNAEFVSMTLPVVSSSPVLRIAALFIMTSDSYSGYQKNRTRKIYAGEARNGLVKTSIFTDPIKTDYAASN